MEKQIKLEGKPRVKQEKLAPEYMPAVCYGNNVESFTFAIKKSDFGKILEEAGESHLINLKVGDRSAKVLIKDVQLDPVRNLPVHADFYEVNMKEEVHAEISLDFIGESKAVKELGGILVKSLDAVRVVCLPDALVDNITIDISHLDNLEDNITLADIKLPESIKLDHYESLDIIVAMIAAPKKQEEEAPVAEGEEKKDEKKEEKKEEEKK